MEIVWVHTLDYERTKFDLCCLSHRFGDSVNIAGLQLAVSKENRSVF